MGLVQVLGQEYSRDKVVVDSSALGGPFFLAKHVISCTTFGAIGVLIFFFFFFFFFASAFLLRRDQRN